MLMQQPPKGGFFVGEIMKKKKIINDQFKLYDLRVEIIKTEKKFVCSHKEGEYFDVRGENLIFSKDQKFSMYALSTILPFLPAKQRKTDENDWITTDTDIACPDPNCGATFRITRIGKRTFRHSEVTVVPLVKKGSKNDRKV